MISRRELLKRIFFSHAAISAPAFNTITCLGLATSIANAEDSVSDDYKALVCIFLFGGNDSYNMLIPTQAEEYDDYVRSRSDLALDIRNIHQPDVHAQVIPLTIDQRNLSGRHFAINSAARGMGTLFNEGKLSFVANVGTLIEPTTLKQYRNRSVRLPSALFSHNDQRDQWQKSPENTGWLGRATELLADTLPGGKFPSNISLSGSNVMQTGLSGEPFSVTPQGPNKLINSSILDSTTRPSGDKSKHVLSRAYRNTDQLSEERNRFFVQMLGSSSNSITYPDSQLGHSLKTIARTIAARRMNNHKKQTFFVIAPGWDTHQDMITEHQQLLSGLSESLSTFYKDLQNLGVDKQVTTFTASEFGRTLRSNGRGTDHGWGGNSVVMGGAINGGQILGNYPETLLLGDGNDIGKNGRLLPSVSTDQYFAELLQWFGIQPSQLPLVLPNIGNFVSSNELSQHLGIFPA